MTDPQTDRRSYGIGRQPVHTVYVPADRYDAGTVASYGEQARDLLDPCAEVLGADPALIERVRHRLTVQPIDDLRVDFEDGYGIRPDDEEDAATRKASQALPPCPSSGIRIKNLEAGTQARAIRTLELWLTDGGRGVITLPKVSTISQVEAMAVICESLERSHDIEQLTFEIQIEVPQALLAPDGTVPLVPMVHAGQGRVSSLHFGTYDYTAALGIAAAYQGLDHPAADHAKAMMQLAAAVTGVAVSDGSTNVIPVGAGRDDAWRLHARLVRRSLERGFYQGWDLHPAQLPSRFLATFAFFRDGLPAALDRLHNSLERRASGILDEPATVTALAGFVVRALDCGAVDPAEVAFDAEQLRRWAVGDA